MDEVTKYHIEGGIGIGKSRLLEVLESKFGMKVFPEPLDEWRNFQISDDKKINLLQRFYERDNISSPFELQMEIIHSFVERHLEIERTIHQGKGPCIVERSCLSSIFFINQNQEAFSPFERAISIKMARLNFKIFEEGKAKFIFLQANDATMLERCKQRERQEEGMEAYLLAINHNFAHFAAQHNMITVDTTSMSPEEVADEVHRIIINHV